MQPCITLCSVVAVWKHREIPHVKAWLLQSALAAEAPTGVSKYDMVASILAAAQGAPATPPTGGPVVGVVDFLRTVVGLDRGPIGEPAATDRPRLRTLAMGMVPYCTGSNTASLSRERIVTVWRHTSVSCVRALVAALSPKCSGMLSTTACCSSARAQ